MLERSQARRRPRPLRSVFLSSPAALVGAALLPRPTKHVFGTPRKRTTKATTETPPTASCYSGGSYWVSGGGSCFGPERLSHEPASRLALALLWWWWCRAWWRAVVVGSTPLPTGPFPVGPAPHFTGLTCSQVRLATRGCENDANTSQSVPCPIDGDSCFCLLLPFGRGT